VGRALRGQPGLGPGAGEGRLSCARASSGGARSRPGACSTSGSTPGRTRTPGGDRGPLDDAVPPALLEAPARANNPPRWSGIRRAHPAPSAEAWNTRFGPGSLYEAWTRTTVMEGLVPAPTPPGLRDLLDGVGPAGGCSGGGGRRRRHGCGGRHAPADAPGARSGWWTRFRRSTPGWRGPTVPAGGGVRLVPLETGIEHPDSRGVARPAGGGRVIVSLARPTTVPGADAVERGRHGLPGAAARRRCSRPSARRSSPGTARAWLNEATCSATLALPPGESPAGGADPRLLRAPAPACPCSTTSARRTDADDDLRDRWRAHPAPLGASTSWTCPGAARRSRRLRARRSAMARVARRGRPRGHGARLPPTGTPCSPVPASGRGRGRPALTGRLHPQPRGPAMYRSSRVRPSARVPARGRPGRRARPGRGRGAR